MWSLNIQESLSAHSLSFLSDKWNLHHGEKRYAGRWISLTLGIPEQTLLLRFIFFPWRVRVSSTWAAQLLRRGRNGLVESCLFSCPKSSLLVKRHPYSSGIFRFPPAASSVHHSPFHNKSKSPLGCSTVTQIPHVPNRTYHLYSKPTSHLYCQSQEMHQLPARTGEAAYLLCSSLPTSQTQSQPDSVRSNC